MNDHFRYKDWTNTEFKTTWQPNPTKAATSQPINDAEKMRELMHDLTQAVLDSGTNKTHHMKMLVRHRTEWPHLWGKIDEIVSFIESDLKE